jgi:hypothetical protein
MGNFLPGNKLTANQNAEKMQARIKIIKKFRQALQNNYHIMGFWGFNPWPIG